MIDDSIFTPILGQMGERIFNWWEIKEERVKLLEITDLWYLKDRWDSLTTIQQEQLNLYRQTLRDLPQNYESANDAADNFPTSEDWF